MVRPGQWVCRIVITCALMNGCGNGTITPAIPSAVGGYDGEWSGTTSQGRMIAFTVSTDRKVTTITAGYNFNGCSGMKTFANLNLAIGTTPFPTTPAALDPGFGYGSGAPDGPNYTQVYGNFTSSTTASGSLVFGDYTGCGSGGGIWSATKR